jgi:hypothetical protein
MPFGMGISLFKMPSIVCGQIPLDNVFSIYTIKYVNALCPFIPSCLKWDRNYDK